MSRGSESGEFSYPIGARKIRFKALSAGMLRPITLSLTDHNADTILLKVTVEDSRQLRWWLKDFGAQVEVLEPPELRQHFKEIAASLKKDYQ